MVSDLQFETMSVKKQQENLGGKLSKEFLLIFSRWNLA